MMWLPARRGRMIGLLLCGCGDVAETTATVDRPDPPAECAEGAIALPDGSCLRAGVPEGGCSEGFEHDGAGCVAVLPAMPCAPGSMAIPGEVACREVAACGEGTWGDIMVDATTEHVDQQYAGGSSDGSAQAPWTTIQQALTAASPGAVIAVAAGSYAENVTIDRAMTLWGRCPSMVTIVGGTAAPAAVTLSAPGAAVRGVAITGIDRGLGVRGSTEIEAAELWIHDTGSHGVMVSMSAGPAGLALRDSLIEATTVQGILSFGALHLERSVVRNIRLDASGAYGRGVDVIDAGSATVARSLIEGVRQTGVTVIGLATASVDGTLVRDITPAMSEPTGGFAFVAQSDVGRPSLTLSGVVVERSHEAGALITGADVVLSRVTIRDVLPVLPIGGRGVLVQAHPDGSERAVVSISESLIEQVSHGGILVLGSQATVDKTAVRDVDVELSDPVGRGISSEESAITGQPSHVVVTGSTVERVMGIGVGAIGSELELRSSAVLDMLSGQEDYGRGVILQIAPGGTRSSATVDNVTIAGCREFGVALIDSEAALSRIHIHDVNGRADGLFGDGIGIDEGDLHIVDALITRAKRAGVAAIDSRVSMANAVLECNAIDLDGEETTAGALSFVDLGGNRCGCDDVARSCKLVSTGLEPPSAL
jgi:uncharacterized protein DUF1565